MRSVLIVLRERSFSSKKKSLVFVFFSFCSLCFLDRIEGGESKTREKSCFTVKLQHVAGIVERGIEKGVNGGKMQSKRT